jgi:hypothetical protein
MDLKEIANKYRDAWSQGASATAQMFTEDATFSFPESPKPIRGRKAIEEAFTVYKSAFPDMSWDYSLVLTSGEHLVLEGITHCTFKNSLKMGDKEIPATGRSAEVDWVGILKVTPGGQISEFKEYYDPAGMWKKLGVE